MKHVILFFVIYTENKPNAQYTQRWRQTFTKRNQKSYQNNTY